MGGPQDDGTLPTEHNDSGSAPVVPQADAPATEPSPAPPAADDDTASNVEVIEQGTAALSLSDAVHPLDVAQVPGAVPGAVAASAVEAQQAPSSSTPPPPALVPAPDARGSEAQSPDIYALKRIPWRGKTIGIVTQNINGPCPLISICNVLALRGSIQFHADMEMVSYQHLCTLLGDCLMRSAATPTSAAVHVGETEADRARNIEDCFNAFPRLQTGLDVNVRFSSIDGFEFTSECLVFDLLDIRLVHGWLSDPQDADTHAVIAKTSYNQLVERVIAFRSAAADKSGGPGPSDREIQEGLIAETFLEQTASQLTYHGISELVASLRPDQPCVLFRNNHFSTLLKHRDELLVLVTDQGFLHSSAVWETLNNVEGDGIFLDGEFHNIPAQSGEDYRAEAAPATVAEASAQNSDYLLALSLQRQEDEEARRIESQRQVQSRPTSGVGRPQDAVPQQPMGSVASVHAPQGQEMDPDYLLALQLQEEDDRRARAHQQQQQAQQGGGQRTPSTGSRPQSAPRQANTQNAQQAPRDDGKSSGCLLS